MVPRSEPQKLMPPLATIILLLATAAVPPVAGRAGAAGGAGAAERAARDPVLNGSQTYSPGGTIREALRGGVIEPQTQVHTRNVDEPEQSGTEPQEPQDAAEEVSSLTLRDSRCAHPLACIRVEHCDPSAILFECREGRACCSPAKQVYQQRPEGPGLIIGGGATPDHKYRPGTHSEVVPGTLSGGLPSQAYQPEDSSAIGLPDRVYHPNGGVPSQVYQPASGSVPGEKRQPVLNEDSQPSNSVPNQVDQTAKVNGSGPNQAVRVPNRDNIQCRTQPPTTPQRPCSNASPPAASGPAHPSLLPEVGTCGVVHTENRIVNGKKASLGQFPWMALLGYRIRGRSNVTFMCGGTLINDRYVLTAAHCFGPQYQLVQVRLGELNLTSPIDCEPALNICAPQPQDLEIERVITHPDYNKRTVKNDIALVRLTTKVSEFTEFVRPICLPIGVNIREDSKFVIAGWGKTDFTEASGSPVLQFTDVNGVNQSECNELQPPELRSLSKGQLCAGGDLGKDACKGDSGGPLMGYQPLNGEHVTYQIGVVSYGPDNPCGILPLPSIYTRVSAYLPWILKNIAP